MLLITPIINFFKYLKNLISKQPEQTVNKTKNNPIVNKIHIAKIESKTKEEIANKLLKNDFEKEYRQQKFNTLNNASNRKSLVDNALQSLSEAAKPKDIKKALINLNHQITNFPKTEKAEIKFFKQELKKINDDCYPYTQTVDIETPIPRLLNP